MKVLICITRSDTIGGAQNYCLILGNWLLQQGHDVLFVLGGNGELTHRLDQQSISYISIPSLVRPIHPLLDLLSLFSLSQIISRENPDVVSSHSFKSIFLLRILRFLSLRFNHVSTVHGWSHIRAEAKPYLSFLYSQIERHLAQYSDHIITVCRSDYRYALSYGLANKSRLSVVHNGINPASPTDCLSPPFLPCTSCNFVVVSRFEYPKDPVTIIKALKAIDSLDVSITFYGDGPLLEMTKKIASLYALRDKVHFMGFDVNALRYLPSYDSFVLSSLSEGFPLSILEAMSSSLPVIASNVGGVSEAVFHGINGLLFEPQDMRTLAMHMHSIAVNPLMRRSYGEAAYKAYSNHFTSKLMCENTLRIFREAITAPLSF